ncbi:MAG: hypothetical protein JNK24_02510 [Alphaproteobacteria bacterium]|nr:hypothetical protein [Alphaproteobacteria bacterium]
MAPKSPTKKSKKKTLRGRFLLAGFLLTSLAILPTTVLFFIGMLPSIICRFVDRSHLKQRTLTVAFMNFAAVFPSWYKMVTQDHTFEHTVNILTEPVNIVIMYGGALLGYMIDWGVSGIVSSMVVQKGQNRLRKIKELQSDLISRWGDEVSGDVPLDAQGFPLQQKQDH